MARSHHRKKHKEHLRQFKHSQETTVGKVKGKASSIFPIAGSVLGFAIGFFASNGGMLAMAIGLVIGAIAGWLLGRKIDQQRWIQSAVDS